MSGLTPKTKGFPLDNKIHTDQQRKRRAGWVWKDRYEGVLRANMFYNC